jgi:flagellar motor component MotA
MGSGEAFVHCARAVQEEVDVQHVLFLCGGWILAALLLSLILRFELRARRKLQALEREIMDEAERAIMSGADPHKIFAHLRKLFTKEDRHAEDAQTKEQSQA